MMTRTFSLMPLFAVTGCIIGPRETNVGDQNNNLPVSGTHFTLECPQHAVGAFDSARSLISGQKLDCTAHVADRFGAPLAGVAVTFLAEAGRVRGLETSSVEGTVGAGYETGLPLPVDTDPMVFVWSPDIGCTASDKQLCTGQYLVPLWMEPQTWTTNPLSTLRLNNPVLDRNNLREPRRFDPVRRLPNNPTMSPVNNPRDNLVTLIAVTNGQEGFKDDNGNGTWDVDEMFTDTTEPFVDGNDNGTWDPGEQYVDTNTNGLWDGKNQRWDKDTKVWAQERILWTGAPALQDEMGAEPVVYATSAFTLACANQDAGAPCTQAGPTASGEIYIADPWFNAPARGSATDGCSVDAVQGSPVSMSVSYAGSATYPAGYRASVLVTDVRDPSAPGSTIPTRNPAVAFTRLVTCRFTASEAGQQTTVTLPLSGSVQ